MPLERTELPRRCVLLFGQEGPGLTEEAREHARTVCSIAQFGSTRSINAGAAAAIAMHAWIQRYAEIGDSPPEGRGSGAPGTCPYAGSRTRRRVPPGHAGRRTSTTRKRLATKALSHRAAFAAGLPPEPWKSENAAVWLT